MKRNVEKNHPSADDGVLLQLTQTNEALLLSGLHQHELTEEAVKLNARLAQEIAERKLAEAALQSANEQLADQAGELERLVAERTEKLRQTVAELQEFSYSVAHDLRTPLRGMQGFASLLLKDHAKFLNPQALSYLERIATSASRMDSLIQDVLNYTRVSRGEALLVPVDLDVLVRDIIATYPDWHGRTVAIDVEGKLPLVLGHEGFLTQCVSNLLSNSIKFIGPGITPRVRIWAEDRSPDATQAPWPPANEKVAEGWATNGPVVRVWFEDNGRGILTQDHERVFRMFERINPIEEFEGTGVGLTIVRKALERMGGRVDFQSDAGKGSRFWFELKKALPSPP